MVLRLAEDVHVLGPLVPLVTAPKCRTMNLNEVGTRTNVDIETFLGETLVQHGKQSVFLSGFFSFQVLFELHNFPQVCFGSVHWPSVPGYVDELIEALVTLEFEHNESFNTARRFNNIRYVFCTMLWQ